MKKRLLSLTLALTLALTVMATLVRFPGGGAGTVSADSNYCRQVAALVNRERGAQGRSYLMYSSALCQAANKRAEELAESFSHTRPDGTKCFTVLSEYGISYNGAAENIAAGQSTPSSVVKAWMNSSGHRANILNRNFNCIGVGCVYRNNCYYWVQLFVNSGSLSGPTPVAESQSTTAETTAKTTSAAATTTTTTATTASTTVTTATTAPATPATPSQPKETASDRGNLLTAAREGLKGFYESIMGVLREWFEIIEI